MTLETGHSTVSLQIFEESQISQNSATKVYWGQIKSKIFKSNEDDEDDDDDYDDCTDDDGGGGPSLPVKASCGADDPGL